MKLTNLYVSTNIDMDVQSNNNLHLLNILLYPENLKLNNQQKKQVFGIYISQENNCPFKIYSSKKFDLSFTRFISVFNNFSHILKNY